MIETVQKIRGYGKIQLKELKSVSADPIYTKMEVLLNSKVKSSEQRLERFIALAQRYAF
jgi:hypothetical protein